MEQKKKKEMKWIMKRASLRIFSQLNYISTAALFHVSANHGVASDGRFLFL